MLKLAGYFFSGGLVVSVAGFFRGILGKIWPSPQAAASAFNKPAKTYIEQIAILRGRGLTVADEPLAIHCLSNYNYYRLSAYRYPFCDPLNSHQFLPGTSFEDIWNLYCFDRSIRNLVNEAAKRVEISARSRWSYELGHAFGPLAYENPSNFRNRNAHRNTLKKIDGEIARSKEDFILHYRNTYGMPRPPIWVVCEVMSFRNVSYLYDIIADNAVKKRVSATYGLHSDIFSSLLHHLAYVRNLCAHHSRLWNRRFTITMKMPQSYPADVVASINPQKDRQIYNTLCMLAHMMNVIEPGHDWTNRVRTLVAGYPFPAAQQMGFPANWQTLPIWI